MNAINEYALYRGDEFLYAGSAEEVAKYAEVSKNHIYSLVWQTKRADKYSNALQVYKIEGEDEYERLQIAEAWMDPIQCFLHKT